MQTILLLMVQFDGKTQIPLESICEEFLGMKPKTAAFKAAAKTLPIPAYKMRDSERAGWFIDIRDLAAHIDQQRLDAKKHYEQIEKRG